MKKLILLELALLFLATTFSSNPPGWYQQSLPVNDYINDIFFLDSLNGWVATNSDGSASDTAYVMKTSDAGNNWIIQERSRYYYTKVQFLDSSTGYLCGSTGAALVWKSTNGGNTWFELFNFGLSFAIDDIQFLNEDTGWVCSSDFDFGGIWKTKDGGSNWIRQLSPTSFPLLKIRAISILNKDSGWAINNGTLKELYRTTNGGANWNVQYTFSEQLNDILFLNKDIGIISGVPNIRTTNSGFNWILSNDFGIGLSFGCDSVGWAGDIVIQQIHKTTNQGLTWFRQTTNTNNPTPFALSSLNAWAGGNKLIHTNDGGGLSSVSENNIAVNSFILKQNYPNPFNPKTVINYELRITNHVTLKIFDVQGKEVTTLVNERQNAGNYEIEFNGNSLSSGVYFYRIVVSMDKRIEIQSETKKMILVR